MNKQFHLISDKSKIRLFKEDGVEILEEDLIFLQNKTKLYASNGENYDTNASFADYKQLKVLGQGGFGKVVLVQHKKTKEKVAMKFINSAAIGNAQDIDMVFREIEMLKALNHTGIVKIYNAYTLPLMEVVLVMEYLEGGELLQYVEERGRLSEDEAREFFIQIVDAVNYCHRNKLIHRDLKLENIILESSVSRKVKLIDFGVAGKSS